MDTLENLTHTELTPQEAFDSSCRDSRLSVEEYEICRSAWCDEDMTTFKDFLVWYNNLDVLTLLEAVDKQSRVYAPKRIDMFKGAISLPGLTMQWMFTEC